MITTLTVYQPHYGPLSEPYRVRARFADTEVISHFWTEYEALEARDKAFDAGAHSVHVAGLPLRVVSAGFPVVEGPLPEVAEG